MELSRKAAMNLNETATAPKLLSLLNRSSCWKVVILYYRRILYEGLLPRGRLVTQARLKNEFQGHPMTVLHKISVPGGKYCLKFSIS